MIEKNKAFVGSSKEEVMREKYKIDIMRYISYN